MAGKGVLIVVAARGGSKGLPRKNTRLLGDIPLLDWTAQAVRAAALDEAVCLLSTDDPEIAGIGRNIGLDVPFMRPAELATDEATAESVALHALDWVSSNRGIQPDAVMWLQPTSPFRPPSSLSAAVALLRAGDFSGVIGVKPVYRTLRTLFHADERMALVPVDQRTELTTRRQAQGPLFTPNGALYLVSATELRSAGSFFTARCGGIAMDQIASLDIDDAIDWNIAEAVAAAGFTWRGRISGAGQTLPV